MKKVEFTVLLVLFILILTACKSDTVNNEWDSGEDVHLKFGTTSAGSGPFAYLVALANSLKEGTNGRINADVVETGASLDNIRLLKRGDIDFGVITGSAQFDAYNGEGVFSNEEPYEELRMFLPFSTSPITIVVRADSGINSIYDLNERKFNAGFAGTSTSEDVKVMLSTLGIKPKYVQSSLEDAMEMMKNREIDGLAKSTSLVDVPDASILSLSALTNINILGFSKEDAERIENENPKFVRFEVPANIYKNQSSPLNVFGHVAAVAAPTTLSEEIVYEMFKAVVEEREMQEEAYPPLRKYDYFQLITEESPIPLHPGVIRYLEEKEIEVPEKLK